MECQFPINQKAVSSTGLGRVTFNLGSAAMALWMAWMAFALPDQLLSHVVQSASSFAFFNKQVKKKTNLRATPFDTSQLSMFSARWWASSEPSSTNPNPPAKHENEINLKIEIQFTIVLRMTGIYYHSSLHPNRPHRHYAERPKLHRERNHRCNSERPYLRDECIRVINRSVKQKLSNFLGDLSWKKWMAF